MSMRSATPEILGQTTGWFATRNERRTRQVEWCCNMHIRARKKCVTSKNGQNNLKEFGQANHLSSKYCFFFFYLSRLSVFQKTLSSIQCRFWRACLDKGGAERAQQLLPVMKAQSFHPPHVQKARLSPSPPLCFPKVSPAQDKALPV